MGGWKGLGISASVLGCFSDGHAPTFLCTVQIEQRPGTLPSLERVRRRWGLVGAHAWWRQQSHRGDLRDGGPLTRAFLLGQRSSFLGTAGSESRGPTKCLLFPSPHSWRGKPRYLIIPYHSSALPHDQNPKYIWDDDLSSSLRLFLGGGGGSGAEIRCLRLSGASGGTDFLSAGNVKFEGFLPPCSFLEHGKDAWSYRGHL